MNKVEYLSALKEALKDTDASVMEEIVSDYEEHFQFGLESGKTEEQICEDLGAIDDLIEEIKEVYNMDYAKDEKGNDDQKDSKSKMFKDWHINIPNIDGEKIGNVINNALDSAGEAISKIDVVEIGHTLKSTLGQATSSLNNFADNYLKNQGGSPFDFNKRKAEGFKENVTKSYDSSEETEDKGRADVSYTSEPDAEASESAQTESEKKTCKAEASGDEKSFEKAEASESGCSCEKGEAEESECGCEKGEAADTECVCEKGETADRQCSCEEEEAEDNESSCEESDFAGQENDFEKQESVSGDNDAENSEKTGTGLNLVIDGICADVIVQKSANNKINISYVNNGNERQKQMYEFYSYKEGNTVYAGIRRVGKAVFLFNLKLYSININVELPDNMSDVNIKTASGDIKIDNVRSDRMTAGTASGDISMSRVFATDLRIKASSGDIRLEELNSIKLSANTLSGDVNANTIDAKFLSLKSTSGDVEARNLNADIIDNSSLSGDLDIVNIKASECKIRTTSGNIRINEFTMNNADVSSVSGDIKLPRIIGDGLRVGSTSGNVTLEVNVKRCHASSKSGNVDVKCDGDIVLESSSTSGNVNVVLKNFGNGYCVKSRTTSGELYINYNNIRQRNLKTGTYTFGNQGSELIVSTVSGDIRLTD